MNKAQFHRVLWVMEAVVGALPATVYALFWVLWFIWIGFVNRSVFIRDPASAVFLPYIAVAIATTLGMLGLWTGLLMGPAELCRRPRVTRIAILFSCAGVLVDVPFLVLFGVGTIRGFDPHQLLMDWMLLGPLVVGIHCFWRVWRYGHDLSQPCKQAPGANG